MRLSGLVEIERLPYIPDQRDASHRRARTQVHDDKMLVFGSTSFGDDDIPAPPAADRNLLLRRRTSETSSETAADPDAIAKIWSGYAAVPADRTQCRMCAGRPPLTSVIPSPPTFSKAGRASPTDSSICSDLHDGISSLQPLRNLESALSAATSASPHNAEPLTQHSRPHVISSMPHCCISEGFFQKFCDNVLEAMLCLFHGPEDDFLPPAPSKFRSPQVYSSRFHSRRHRISVRNCGNIPRLTLPRSRCRTIFVESKSSSYVPSSSAKLHVFAGSAMLDRAQSISSALRRANMASPLPSPPKAATAPLIQPFFAKTAISRAASCELLSDGGASFEEFDP